MKVVTAKQLEAKGACGDQVVLFRSVFPRGCVVTAANIHKAARAGLNLGWWAEQFLPAPALRAYQEARAPALRAYEEARAPAWRAYEETAPALIVALGLKEKP